MRATLHHILLNLSVSAAVSVKKKPLIDNRRLKSVFKRLAFYRFILIIIISKINFREPQTRSAVAIGLSNGSSLREGD